jgi:hypothetical protein
MSQKADESDVCSEVSYPSLSAVTILFHSFAAGYTEALLAPKHVPQAPATQLQSAKDSGAALSHNFVGNDKVTPLFPFEESEQPTRPCSFGSCSLFAHLLQQKARHRRLSWVLRQRRVQSHNDPKTLEKDRKRVKNPNPSQQTRICLFHVRAVFREFVLIVFQAKARIRQRHTRLFRWTQFLTQMPKPH